ncbi:hypothetical protein [Sphingobium sp.]
MDEPALSLLLEADTIFALLFLGWAETCWPDVSVTRSTVIARDALSVTGT